jgi:hypothetical protein
MPKERGAELFRALHAIIDVVTNLNLRELEVVFICRGGHICQSICKGQS